jgi:hypothetical protein
LAMHRSFLHVKQTGRRVIPSQRYPKLAVYSTEMMRGAPHHPYGGICGLSAGY